MQQYREHFVSSCWVPLTANIAWHEKDLSGETPLFDDLYKLQPFDVFSKARLYPIARQKGKDRVSFSQNF
jgi:hypothetical protein